ncbi:MAG: SAM-dependent methyltransferase [Neptuniibacter caesariensis]|uniref:SAM-dependent methyltransferase n=1 Tax=Neptuniibacter caesariensis TaxID=207954 RepID=A0A2G6JS55_NEPCE|nr:MAG: SAM-dependent methyltransferase [Neptuniibacter caesariensis]
MSFPKQFSLESAQQPLKEWFDTELGQELLAEEQSSVERILATLFGVNLVQFSVDSRIQLYKNSPVTHCFSVIPALDLGISDKNIVARTDEVPLAHESVDVVLLHHALDFTDSPHQVLREASRILRPGGHVVIVGFNPLSYWGLYRYFCREQENIPWLGHFISHHRLSDWLKLLELTELKHLSGYYRFPFESRKWRRRLHFMGNLAQRMPGHTGAYSIILARKDIAGMTPLRSGWGLRRLMPLPVVEPSTRHSLRKPCEDR